MNKKFAILLLLPLVFLSGCSVFSGQEKQVRNEEWNLEEVFTEIGKEEELKLKPICEQEMIPAEYAQDCYFRELKNCEALSGKMIPKSELEKCLPVFLRDEIQNN